MRGFKLISVFLLNFLMLFSLTATSGENLTVLSVGGERIDNTFVTELRFNKEIKNVEEYTVDFINETIQVNIPSASFINTKEFSRVDDSTVRNLYTYQVDGENLRHRIILKKGLTALKYESKVQIVASGAVLKIIVSNEDLVTITEKQDEKQKVVTEVKDSDLSSIITALPEKSQKSEKSVTKKVEEQDLKAQELELISQIEKSQNETKNSIKVKAKESYDEKDVPVLGGIIKESSIKTSSSNRVFFSLIVIALLGFGMFFYIKKYSHRIRSKNKQTHIKVMTQHYLGPKKSLAIVNVAGESILVGITDQNISHIKTLSLIDDEFSEATPKNFSTALSTSKGISTNNSTVSSAGSPTLSNHSAKSEIPINQTDEFSMKGLKDLVSTKLKGMRDL